MHVCIYVSMFLYTKIKQLKMCLRVSVCMCVVYAVCVCVYVHSSVFMHLHEGMCVCNWAIKQEPQSA
jgi:hypothetical protein